MLYHYILYVLCMYILQHQQNDMQQYSNNHTSRNALKRCQKQPIIVRHAGIPIDHNLPSSIGRQHKSSKYRQKSDTNNQQAIYKSGLTGRLGSGCTSTRTGQNQPEYYRYFYTDSVPEAKKEAILAIKYSFNGLCFNGHINYVLMEIMSLCYTSQPF